MEFQQLWEVGVFFYLVTSCLKSRRNGFFFFFWSCEAVNVHALLSQRKGTECLMGTILGQSMVCYGAVLVSPEPLYGLKLSMCFVCMLLLGS